MLCSFCAIPQIRGPYRSRKVNSILKEAERYKEFGFQEINLVSQNSTSYGKDLSQKSLLPELLKELSKLEFEVLRVLYLMPEEVTDEIIDAFSAPYITPYFDLPFQHVSKTVLKRMKRGGSYDKNLSLIRKIRHKFPDAVVRSTFIVGFPGETEADFQELVKFAQVSEIERFGVFGYSPEENTAAFNLKKRISDEIIKERVDGLMDISDTNVLKYNQKLVNTTHLFLPQGPCPWEAGSTIGRIPSQSPESDGMTQAKKVFDDNYRAYKIKITGFQDEILYGVPL